MSTPTATVLVVDDDPAVLGSVTFLLRAEGYEVHAHGSAGALLAAAPPCRPACLLLDLHLPEMDGLEVMRRLHVRGDRWPVVLMTGDLEPPGAETARRSGAFAVLEKPFVDEALIGTVARAVEHAARDGVGTGEGAAGNGVARRRC